MGRLSLGITYALGWGFSFVLRVVVVSVMLVMYHVERICPVTKCHRICQSATGLTITNEIVSSSHQPFEKARPRPIRLIVSSSSAEGTENG